MHRVCSRIGSALAAALCLPVTADAVQYYAVTGNYANFDNPQPNVISFTNYLYEMSRYGIGVDRVILTDGLDSKVPGKLHGYQIAAALVDNAISDAWGFTGQGKIVLDLSNLFFESTEYGEPGVPCLGYGSEPNVLSRWNLRSADLDKNGAPDYVDRMQDFMNRIFGTVSASDFEFISVHAESGCIPDADITAAAQTVKAAIPGVQVAAGYPISIDAPPSTDPGHGLNHNGKYPAILDRVITWSYGVYNPAASHPLNYSNDFASYYSQFLAKLRPHHTIDWVTDGHFLNCRHGSVCFPGATGMGWIQGIHHAQAIANWCNWLPGQPRINGQIAFTYAPVAEPGFFSVAEMPQIVRDTHANVSTGLCAVPHTLVAADAFTGVVQGAGLNGRVTEVGNRSWIASASAKFASGGVLGQGDLTGTSGAGPFGTLAFTPSSQGNKPVTVTAVVNPAGADWMAIGFTNHANWGWWVDGQVWVLIKNSSRYNVLANGTAISLTGGEKFDSKLRPNQFNRVELTYEPSARRVTLWINGWQLLPPTAIPSGFVPAINYAGWSGLNVTQGQSRLDAFELKVLP